MPGAREFCSGSEVGQAQSVAACPLEYCHRWAPFLLLLLSLPHPAPHIPSPTAQILPWGPLLARALPSRSGARGPGLTQMSYR